MKNLKRGAILSLLVLLTACVGGKENSSEEAGDSSTQYAEMGDDYGLTTEIRGDRSFSRSWVRPEVEKITSLSEGEEYTLLDPKPAAVSEEGHLYIYDYGDYTVKEFTRQGEYVATYGRGMGQGPGEMRMMTDIGVWRDSLVYVVDPRQGRVSFFEKGGDFLRSELFEPRVAKLELTKRSIGFGIRPPDPSLPSFVKFTSPPARQTTVLSLFSDDVNPILYDGQLHTDQKQVLYVPLYFPILVTFEPSDTSGIAYPTPDYGESRPKVRTKNDGRQVFAPTTRFHFRSTLHDGVLSVEIPSADLDSLQYDLYDTREMEYMHSIRLPIDQEGADYAHGLGLIITYKNATINVYKVY